MVFRSLISTVLVFWSVIAVGQRPRPYLEKSTFAHGVPMFVDEDGAIASSSQPPQNSAQEVPLSLGFVRTFSAADDVRRPLHPVLNRTLDIIAGPKLPAPSVGRLLSPSAVTSDSNSRVFVADPGAKGVHVFDFIRSKYSFLSERLRSPVSVASDSQGNLYITDKSSRTVLTFNSTGRFRGYLGKLRGGESYFDSPAGIAIDRATGHIYVCDTHRHMIIVMNGRGRLVAKIGKRGGGDQPGEFKVPSQAVVNGDELFVLDEGNARIQIFGTAGHFRRVLNLGYADSRTGMAVDRQGDIYVSDPGLKRIQVFSHEGRPMYTFDPGTIKGANLSHPSAMWVSAGHCLYVIDLQSNRVGLFQISGESAPQCR